VTIKEQYRGPSGKMLPGLKIDLEEALGRLNKLFAGKQVALAYLFGSYAAGTNDESSDIDLAILLTDQNKKTKDFLTELITDLQQLLETERFDLMLLNNASPLIKKEIVSSGRIIHACSEMEQENFEMKVLQEYLDTAYLRKVQNEYLQKRVEQWFSEKKASSSA